MILGGKLPGKVGRCRFFLAQNIFTIQRKDSSHAVFFHFGNVATFRKYGFLRSSMRHCRKEGNHETCRTAPARYMDVAGFLLPWFTQDRDKKLRAGARSLWRAPFYLLKYFYYVGDIAWQYLRNIDKSTLRSGAHGWAPYAHRNLRFRDAHFCLNYNTEER